jgi:hypothetical protein
LPMFPDMKVGEVKFVINTIKKFIIKNKIWKQL